MSEQSGLFVRGFGDLESRRGGIAWSLPDGAGGVALADGKASPAEADAIGEDSHERWSFYLPVEADPLKGAVTFRHLAVETADGVIVCTAAGPEGMAGHGEESAAGVMRVGESEIPYEEALISTQYDGDGDPTRFGLELWPQDADQTSRTAATRVSGSLLAGARNGHTWAGLFRCHAEGFEGLGTYLLWRA